jgi:hypothetical protein
MPYHRSYSSSKPTYLYYNLDFLRYRDSLPTCQHSMSLDTLSGELILIITDYLSEHPGALPTLCLVSKRVRKFAELALYKHIVPRGDGKFRATKFLMTLMKRNDLALRATTVDAQEETYDRVTPQIQRNLAVHEAAIRRLIANLTSIASRSSQLPTNQQQWCLDITAPRPGGTNSSTIALILCMVINVNRAHLSYQHDSFGCLALELLATSWKDAETRPFRHLESVIIHGMASFKSSKATLPCSMNTLGFDNDSISVNSSIFPIPPHTLKLKRVINLTPDLLQNILSCEYLVGLKVLIVERRRPEGNLSFSDADLNMGLLVKALARNTPLLERFTWINRPPPRWWYMSPGNKFGSFKSLSKLKHLHVERGNFTNDHLFSHATICALQRNISEGLQSLTIADYPKMLPGSGEPLTSPILRTSHKTTDLTQALSRAFVSPTSKFCLRRLTLTVRMESYSNDGYKLHDLDVKETILLRHMADELAKSEFIFEVHRRIPGEFGYGYRLLVGPGWTAPLPHARHSDEGDSLLP